MLGTGKFYDYKGFRIWKYDEPDNVISKKSDDNKYFEMRMKQVQEDVRNTYGKLI